MLVSETKVAAALASFTLVLLLTLYRWSLREDYENTRLYLGRKVAWLVGSRLKERIGHVLYRMRLSVFEAGRLGIDLTKYHAMLVFIEDKRHFEHNGNSIKAAAAALYRRVRYGTRSGASTIHHQLVRSNFLKSIERPISRKIVEMDNCALGQQDVLKVRNSRFVSLFWRYERGVIGLPAAIRHFFPQHELSKPLDIAQRFFLLERLSNVTGTFPKKELKPYCAVFERRGLSNLRMSPKLVEFIGIRVRQGG
ncbi:transglycosylase domain-containing protein [Sphingomonas sp. J315]|uniref:transglycosylase domain-containing protein n=1 Tax=Sphingomonas sp. J315 TaxID=2898433 RepID=UPI0021ADF38E|nr:transglycosylase domain-containing protein [Sphingomonas sp. J315]UUX99621.1 transglycosylase domain-containing protein [Sphingomonas sp. J315]